MSLTPEICEQLTSKLEGKHIMLSYNWGVQELVVAVYEYITSKNIPAWMDIKGGVHGNINAAMAKGVEGALVICPFMTEDYENSTSCEVELNYAKDCQVTVVPCMVQDRRKDGSPYKARGWLGVITAGKLWKDFKNAQNDKSLIEKRTDELLIEIANALDIKTGPGSFTPAPQSTAPSAPPPASKPPAVKQSPREGHIVASFQPNGGIWTVDGKSIQCGMNGDIPVPADYFNEGQKRIAVFRPSNGVWYIKGKGYDNWGKSTGNIQIQCGCKGDVPVPGDYEGNGVISIAVWRPGNGTWYIKGPGNGNWGKSGGNKVIQAGMSGDIPVPVDYFNEGKLRIAVWRPSNGNWYIKGAGFNNWGGSDGNISIQCGCNGDVPVPEDYLGDGTVRFAVWRPGNGNWYIKGSGTAAWGNSQGNVVIQCGTNGDKPVPYDFYGEGKPRIAVYRPSNGVWYVKGVGLGNWGATNGNITNQGPAPFDGQNPVKF